MSVSYRSNQQGEPFFNYLGQREVDDDDDLQVMNAYNGEQLVGSIVYDIGKTDGAHVWVRHVYVTPAWRHTGIFRQLAAFAVEDAAWQRRMRGDNYQIDGDFIQAELRDWFKRQLEQHVETADDA